MEQKERERLREEVKKILPLFIYIHTHSNDSRWKRGQLRRTMRETERERVKAWHGPGHGVADSATKRHAARGISRASREGSGTDGLRGFERNHGNVASPGRLPSDWLFLAFPPIYLGYSHEFRHAAQHRRRCPIIIYGAARKRIPRVDAVMAEAWGRHSDIGVAGAPSTGKGPDNSVEESFLVLNKYQSLQSVECCL